MKGKGKIRSVVGYKGMIIYTPDQKQVCIAYDKDGNSYNIRNEPSFLWYGKEELFYLTYIEERTPKESRNLFIRLILEFLVIGFLPYLLSMLNIFTFLKPRQIMGMQMALCAIVFIIEFSIWKGIKKRKSENEKVLLKWRGALNMAINSFEKQGKPPTLEEAKKSSIYRADRNYNMHPNEIVGIIFVFLSISFFMPTVLIQLITLPVLILVAKMAFSTSLFGIMSLTNVLFPELYELKMACDLVEFWYEISFNTPIIKR